MASLLLAGCAGASAATPTWVPQPSFTGDGGQNETFGPAQGTTSPDAGPTSPGASSPSPGATPTQDPQVVATKLSAPTGIAVLPDGTALVGERTTGQIVRVQPVAGRPVPVVRTLSVDGSGDGGLLDLAISPTYSEDGLIYAYITTPTDNRVVDFTLTGPATAVLSGIPKAAAGNTGRIMFDPAGELYIGTGDASQPALSANPASLAGKVLQVDDIGRPAQDNPVPTSPVYASGLRPSAGLCQDATLDVLFQDEAAGGGSPDLITIVTAGADYAGATGIQLPAGKTSVGGCAVIGNQFYITSRDAKSLLTAPITMGLRSAALGQFSVVGDTRYGRLLSVVAAPDGALWLSTSNKDGHGTPISDDERVLRIIPPPPGAGGTSPL